VVHSLRISGGDRCSSADPRERREMMTKSTFRAPHGCARYNAWLGWAAFAASARPEHLRSDIRQLFKRNILDTLGGAIAGLQCRPFQARCVNSSRNIELPVAARLSGAPRHRQIKRRSLTALRSNMVSLSMHLVACSATSVRTTYRPSSTFTTK